MKKIFPLLIIILLVLVLLPKQEVSAETFSDVPTLHPYYQEIMFLLDKGVIEEGSKYGVNDKVTREEVAVMVSKAVGLDGSIPEDTKFPDVKKNNKNSGYIQSAINEGIINGYSDGTFRPNEKVTRGHMATFIARGFKLIEQANVTFKDVAKGNTAYEPVRKLAYKNITTGYPDGTFRPNENLSRAHISVFIARALGYGKVYSTKEVVDMNDSKVVLINTNIGQGSGIVIANGLILTNHHVIDGATEATITFSDGEKFDVSGVVESDANKDIAILKTNKIFQTSGVSIRTSSNGLSKGDKVIAIGSPIGLQNTISEGIISSFRTSEGVSLIQTNADIDHGSSGGALFDVNGKLIGMTSSGYDDVSANLNFAIVTEEFLPMVNNYINKDFNSIYASFPTSYVPNPIVTYPTSDQIPVLGDIALGMSMKQVMSLSGGYYRSNTSNSLYFSKATVLDYLADISYEFKNDKLIAINIYHYIVMNQSDINILEAFFEVMYANISNSYGRADILDTNWYDDDYGYMLNAFWVMSNHNLLLTVTVTNSETYGGIRIAISE